MSFPLSTFDQTQYEGICTFLVLSTNFTRPIDDQFTTYISVHNSFRWDQLKVMLLLPNIGRCTYSRLPPNVANQRTILVEANLVSVMSLSFRRRFNEGLRFRVVSVATETMASKNYSTPSIALSLYFTLPQDRS